MKNILLIDADSTIPNIPLMKLSTYYKDKGDNVELVKIGLPYYPRFKKFDYKVPEGYDKVFCSVIFDNNMEHIKGENIIFGGTGVDLVTTLPEPIEQLDCDYSLYPDNDTSYGFITRGCIRNCYFCKVPKKEGMIKKVFDVDKIVRHKKVKFLDNNILAYFGHEEILQELVDKKIKCCFNQGLDIRLITERNSKLLSNIRYLGDYFFSFDAYSYKKIIEERVRLLSWCSDWKIKFFIYVSPNMPIWETIRRVLWVREHRFLPFLMRDLSIWNSDYSNFYSDLAAWCNQPHMFKTKNFYDFLDIRYTNKKRIEESSSLWSLGEKGLL